MPPNTAMDFDPTLLDISTTALAGAASQTFSPLSATVAKILSTSYTDSEFGETIRILDERGVHNTPQFRRNFRFNAQKELLDRNGEVLNDFGKVAEQLRRIGTVISTINETHAIIKQNIEDAQRQTAPFLGEATKLLEEREKLLQEQEIAAKFREQFILTDDEVAVLTQIAEPVDERFFQTLNKAKQISKDCEILLSHENQTLGLEVTEQTTRYINQAFHKLYKWVQREFKMLNLENPQIGLNVRRALRVLAGRPSLFQNCLDFFADSREKILFDAFHAALTGTSQAGERDASVKPIELVAHDMLRYVGDMLAWAHSATVSEREALEVLLVAEGHQLAKDFEASEENELRRMAADGDEPEQTVQFNPIKMLNSLVDRDMSGVARLLLQRVDEVMRTNEDTIVAYKLANLLGFYRATFTKLLDGDAALLDCLGKLETEAFRQFRSLMRDHITVVQGEFQHVPQDLGAPDFLFDALEHLAQIMKTYDTSLTPAENREADFEEILADALDPFVDGCRNMAKTLQEPDSLIFLLNCLMTARNALSPFSFTRSRVQRLESSISNASDMLVKKQVRFFRENSGLHELFDALNDVKTDDVAAIRAAGPVDPTNLQVAAQTLDDFLPSALMDAKEHIYRLQDSATIREVTEAAAEEFCNEFARVDHMLDLVDEKAEEEYYEQGENMPDAERLRAYFPRKLAEIKVLLS